jgi:hypothetical protein
MWSGPEWAGSTGCRARSMAAEMRAREHAAGNVPGWISFLRRQRGPAVGLRWTITEGSGKSSRGTRIVEWLDGGRQRRKLRRCSFLVAQRNDTPRGRRLGRPAAAFRLADWLSRPAQGASIVMQEILPESYCRGTRAIARCAACRQSIAGTARARLILCLMRDGLPDWALSSQSRRVFFAPFRPRLIIVYNWDADRAPHIRLPQLPACSCSKPSNTTKAGARRRHV